MRKVVYMLIVGLLASTVQAASTTTAFLKDVLGKNAAVTPGSWNSNFDKCKKYCKDNNVPFVAVWSNGDFCGHCIDFENSAMQATFKNWMKTSGIVFWFGCPGNGYPNSETGATGPAYLWACAEHGYRESYTVGGPLYGFPFVRIYWPKGKVDYVALGDSVRGGYAVDYKKSASNMVTLIKNKLKMGKSGGWDPSSVPTVDTKYYGGLFDKTIDNVLGSRMEIETGLTTNVTIHIVRNAVDTNAANVATNFIYAPASSWKENKDFAS